MLREWALSMVGVEEGREFRFRGDLYSQESTFPLVLLIISGDSYCNVHRRHVRVIKRLLIDMECRDMTKDCVRNATQHCARF